MFYTLVAVKATHMVVKCRSEVKLILMFFKVLEIFENKIVVAKGAVLLRREISQKVICEKNNFSNCDFAIIFVTMNGHRSTCRLFKIHKFNDVHTKDDEEINAA